MEPSRTTTKKRRPQFVNKGSYGCVFAPPFSCNNNSSISSSSNGKVSTVRLKSAERFQQHVGKLFVDREDYTYEVRAYKIVNKIDPLHEWSLPLIRKCTTHITTSNTSPETNKCPFIEALGPKRLYQIVVPYGGYRLGPELPLTIQAFKTLLQKALYAVSRLEDAGYVHLDIRHSNILIHKNPALGQDDLYIIDYSLLQTAKGLYDYRTNDYIFGSLRTWYPPEFYLYHKFMQDWDITPDGLERICDRALGIFDLDSEKRGLIGKPFGAFFRYQQKQLLKLARDVLVVRQNQGKEGLYEFFKDWALKVDVYGLGTAFLNILERAPSLKGSKRSRRAKAIRSVLESMSDADPRKRCMARDALVELQKVK